MPQVRLSEGDTRRIAGGMTVALDSPHLPGEVAVLDPAGGLIAIGRVDPDGRCLHPEKVFPPA